MLSRLESYVAAYESRLSTVVAEERYAQTLQIRSGSRADLSTTRKQVLTSDLVFLRLPASGEWMGFRDTFLVDEKPVRERQARLEHALSNGQPDALREAIRITGENTRYNLGNDLLVRTINVPTLVLDLLHPRNRLRFSFRKTGEDTIEHQSVWKIDFSERTRPSIIKTPMGTDQLARGTVWVDPGSGSGPQDHTGTQLHGPRSADRDDYRRVSPRSHAGMVGPVRHA